MAVEVEPYCWSTYWSKEVTGWFPVSIAYSPDHRISVPCHRMQFVQLQSQSSHAKTHMAASCPAPCSYCHLDCCCRCCHHCSSSKMTDDVVCCGWRRARHRRGEAMIIVQNAPLLHLYVLCIRIAIGIVDRC